MFAPSFRGSPYRKASLRSMPTMTPASFGPLPAWSGGVRLWGETIGSHCEQTVPCEKSVRFRRQSVKPWPRSSPVPYDCPRTCLPQPPLLMCCVVDLLADTINVLPTTDRVNQIGHSCRASRWGDRRIYVTNFDRLGVSHMGVTGTHLSQHFGDHKVQVSFNVQSFTEASNVGSAPPSATRQINLIKDAP